MPKTLRMTIDGKTSDLDISTWYVTTEFEEKFNLPFTVVLDDKQRRMTWVAFCMYKAAEEQGVPVPAEFKEFLKKNPVAEFIEDENGANTNPTDGEQ